MSIFSWIFTGLFVISLGLYIFFYFRKNTILTKIFACFSIPLMAMNGVSILLNYTPDSNHIIFFIILSFLFCTAGKILQELSEKNIFLTIGKGLFGLSVGVYIFLFSSIFYLNHISQWFTVLALLIASGFSVTLILIIKHKEPIFYITCTFIEIALTLFSYISLLTLIFDCRLYSILLFSGALLSQIYATFHLVDVKKLKLKHGKFIKEILLIISQALVSTACILIFAID